MTIEYRQMTSDECKLIKDLNPSRFIKRSWRKIKGNYQWVILNHKDKDYPEGKENHFAQLNATFKNGGFAVGAFDEKILVGFCSVNNEFFGNHNKYLLLDQLFVANTYQDRGIGKKLFYLAAENAIKLKADKLYICSASSEDTLGFYKSLGCIEATEVNISLLMHDKNDIQMEYDLHKNNPCDVSCAIL